MPRGGERRHEVRIAVAERRLAEFGGVPEAGEAFGEGGGEGGGVAGLGEHADLRSDEFGDGGGLQADAGAAGGESFEVDQAETFTGAGEGEAGAIGQGLTQLGVGNASGELDAVGDAQFGGEGLEARSVVAVADEAEAGDEFRVGVEGGRGEQGEGAKEEIVALVGVGGAEAADAENDGWLAGRRGLGGGAGEEVGIEGVGDDAEAGRQPGVKLGQPVAGVSGNAIHAVAAAEGEGLERGGFLPDLDAVGDEGEAAAGTGGEGGDGELGEVAADDAARAGAGGPGGAHVGGLGAGAGGGGEGFAVQLAAGKIRKAGEVGGGVVERDQGQGMVGGILGEGPQVKPQDALNAAVGGGEFRSEEGGFHKREARSEGRGAG